VNREKEILQLGALYGMPLRRRCVLEVNEETYRWWTEERPRRRHGEVVMFIRRLGGNLVLHTKGFYPPGAFRVPSGGIKKRELLADAVLRETYEETGLQVAIERFLAIVDFEFRCGERSIPFSSHLFLLREVGGDLKPQDLDEGITAFREVTPADLPAVAVQLESVAAEWRDWGQFRAYPHRLAAELLLAGT